MIFCYSESTEDTEPSQSPANPDAPEGMGQAQGVVKEVADGNEGTSQHSHWKVL